MSRFNDFILVLLKPIYKVYEKWLWLQIKNGVFPRHIGIIPDGNRRWASKAGLDAKLGHIYGYENLKRVLKMIWELGIKCTTIYAMSTENCLYRSEEERRSLFELAKKGLEEILELNEIHENRIKVRVIGRLDLVPKDVLEVAKKVEEATKDYDNMVLNIALCYGGRQEIISAVKSIVKDVVEGRLGTEDVNEEVFTKYLYTPDIPDVDLVIRTSGEERISNFLLWQTAYSELYFCDTLWPDFRKIDFWRAIRSYQKRERRFGR